MGTPQQQHKCYAGPGPGGRSVKQQHRCAASSAGRDRRGNKGRRAALERPVGPGGRPLPLVADGTLGRSGSVVHRCGWPCAGNGGYSAIKHSAPLEPGLSFAPLLRTFGSAGAGSIIPTVTTNIRLRWSRVYHTHRYYKHSAPLEPGLSFAPLLQTFGSAGAGSNIHTVTTNIRLRWSRVYHTHRYYKHSAPLEPGLSFAPLLQTFGSAGAGSNIPTVTTNIRLRWSRVYHTHRYYKHSAPLEPGPTYAADLLLLTCNLQLATSHRPGQRAAAAVTA